MRVLLLSVLLFSAALSGNCGVYSNGCERISGVSWSTITKYKVSCDFGGYVSKITEYVENYSNDACTSTSFMSNEYQYSLKKTDNAENTKDSAEYTTVLKKATMKSADTDTLANRKIICTPAAKQGKTYSWKDITCKLFFVDMWSMYRERLNGGEFKSTVVFKDQQLSFSAEAAINYKKVSSFLGCWQWWSILLLIVGIIIVVVAIVVLVMFLVKRKGSKKSVPKKAKK